MPRDQQEIAREWMAWRRLAKACGVEEPLIVADRARVLIVLRSKRCGELLDAPGFGPGSFAFALMQLAPRGLACGCSTEGLCPDADTDKLARKVFAYLDGES